MSTSETSSSSSWAASAAAAAIPVPVVTAIPVIKDIPSAASIQERLQEEQAQKAVAWTETVNNRLATGFLEGGGCCRVEITIPGNVPLATVTQKAREIIEQGYEVKAEDVRGNAIELSLAFPGRRRTRDDDGLSVFEGLAKDASVLVHSVAATSYALFCSGATTASAATEQVPRTAGKLIVSLPPTVKPAVVASEPSASQKTQREQLRCLGWKGLITLPLRHVFLLTVASALILQPLGLTWLHSLFMYIVAISMVIRLILYFGQEPKKTPSSCTHQKEDEEATRLRAELRSAKAQNALIYSEWVAMRELLRKSAPVTASASSVAVSASHQPETLPSPPPLISEAEARALPRMSDGDTLTLCGTLYVFEARTNTLRQVKK